MEAIAPQTPLAAAADPAVSRSRDGLAFLAVLACFVLSGFAALLYQTAWMREFSIVFGTSELAIATVLAAYMAGLALGASLAGRLVGRVRRPILWYGGLELGIAAGALLVPWLLRAARAAQRALIGGTPELVDSGGPTQSLFYLGTAFAVVMLPTTMMGATLPLLTRHAVRRRRQIGPRTGWLYAMNTAGAVAGTVVAAFVLLPELGLRRTVYVGVGVNALVFVVAAAVSLFAPPAVHEGELGAAAESAAADAVSDARARWILPLVLASGAVSFTYEVLWTRLLSHVLGGSIYAFATMLASFLTGITLGGAAAALLARSRRLAAAGFVLSQLGIAALSLWTFGQMDGLPARFVALTGEGRSALAAGATVAALTLLPAALCIGATFPFAMRVLARSAADAGRASAQVFAWNTFGAIAGAIAAGFLVIPALGFAGAVQVAAGTNLALAVATCLLVLWPSLKPLALASAAGAAAIVVAWRPADPRALLAHSSLAPEAELAGEELFSAVGHSATVLLLAHGDYFEIRSNGLPEAAIARRGAPPFGKSVEHYLTLLPVLARPAAKDMLVIGFGGGVALESIPPSLERVDVIELEPRILEANRKIADLRDQDPFQDERLRLIVNDARGALALTDRTWDAIVSQPSHPWTAGASHLYTREFLALCRDHLTPDGVLVQWINLLFLDEHLLRSLAATVLDVFDHARVYRPTPEMLVFLASDAPLDVERELARTGAPIALHPDFWAREGITSVNDLAAVLCLEHEGAVALAGDAEVSTDDRNLLAMRAGPGSVEGIQGPQVMELLFPLDPLLDLDSPFSRDLDVLLDRSYVARRMMYALPNRAIQSTNVLEGAPKKLAQGLSKSSYAFGNHEEGRQDLQAAAALAPDDPRPRFALVGHVLPAAAKGELGTEQFRRQAEALEGEPKLVYEGWKLAGAGRWSDLAALDDELAAVDAVALWYPHATRLRCLWRVRSGDGGRERALEALDLADRALKLEPDPLVYVVRLEAAAAADLPPHVVETLAELVEFAGPRSQLLPPPVLKEVVAALRPWPERLQALAADERVSPARLASLATALNAALAAAGPDPAGAGGSQAFR